MAFSIRLYTNTAEKNRIVKNDYVTRIMELNGVLKAPTSISNPSVVIETANGIQDLTKVNYAYCFQFHRWYFIVDMISISNKLTQLNLKCDVLMSFRTDLMLNTGMVARNEFDYDPFVVDSLMPYKDTLLVDEDFVTDVTSNSLVNGSFDVTSVQTTHKRFLISYVTSPINPNDMPDFNYNDFIYPPGADEYDNPTRLPILRPDNIHVKRSTAYVVCDTNSISDFIKQIYGNNALATFVKGIYYYPLDIPYQAQTYTIYLGDNLLVGDFNIIENTLSKYIVINDFMMPSISSYKDIEDTKYELYIPFYSWIDINIRENAGDRIIIYYSINYEDGSGNVYIYNYSQKRMIETHAVQLGIQIGINSSNNTELNIKQTAIGIKMGMSLLNMALTTAGNMASGKYAQGIANAGTKTASAVGELVTSSLDLRSRLTQSENNSGLTGYYNYLKTRLRITRKRRTITSSDESAYAHQYGLPLMQPRLLSNLHGFTTFDDIHLEHLENAFSNEIDELYSLLRSGVIFPPVTP